VIQEDVEESGEMYPEEEEDRVDPAEYDERPHEKRSDNKVEFYKDKKEVTEKGEKREEEEAAVQGI
jgi:hypothetical protein